MKQSKRISTVIILTILLSSCMPLMHMSNTNSDQVIDPVCNQVINTNVWLSAEYQNTIYHFDSEECRQAFLANPGSFVNQQSNSNNHTMHWGIAGGAFMSLMMVAMLIIL
ncbi:MAG: hypothetical protein CMB80_17010 [Flammeovirgaceae bacterium]|nr:hypothetical protein [Flammeovirgaceae bacterium]MBR07720.1 hypothetical protein [Rickettsiales bacterium]HCX20616.1 hypothetical protein [Cytophagales bacterium]